jgi:hypothetical protein
VLTVQRNIADRTAIRAWAPEERRRRNRLLPAEPLEGAPSQSEVLLEILILVAVFLGMATVASLLLFITGTAAP